MAIPLVNLKKQYDYLREEMLHQIDEVLKSTVFIQAKKVAEFEKAFAQLHGAKFALGCSNGTSAISLALEALGVGQGDEVITTSNTFIATAEGISHVGATPVFVDIDPETYQIDVKKLESALTSKTKAIVPVHLYGNVCDMDAIMALAKKHGLLVLEDCAQAHLASYKGRYVGTFGDAATFSFYPGKNLGAYGDAGLIFTSAEKTVKQAKMLLDHGRASKYSHDIVGYNNRMDEIQAAVLLVKLKYLEKWTNRRRELAAVYDGAFLSRGIQVMQPTSGAQSVYHLYVIQVANRDEVARHLEANGVASGVHYPVPLHLQPAYKHLGYKLGELPICEKLAGRYLSLPMCPELTVDEAQRIAKLVLEVSAKQTN